MLGIAATTTAADAAAKYVGYIGRRQDLGSSGSMSSQKASNSTRSPGLRSWAEYLNPSAWGGDDQKRK